jgi:hypothetical protein
MSFFPVQKSAKDAQLSLLLLLKSNIAAKTQTIPKSSSKLWREYESLVADFHMERKSTAAGFSLLTAQPFDGYKIGHLRTSVEGISGVGRTRGD